MTAAFPKKKEKKKKKRRKNKTPTQQNKKQKTKQNKTKRAPHTFPPPCHVLLTRSAGSEKSGAIKGNWVVLTFFLG